MYAIRDTKTGLWMHRQTWVSGRHNAQWLSFQFAAKLRRRLVERDPFEDPQRYRVVNIQE